MTKQKIAGDSLVPDVIKRRDAEKVETEELLDETKVEKPEDVELISGESLAPRREPLPEEAEYFYWVGLLPDAPHARQSFDLGGQSFPKMTESIHRDEHSSFRQTRIPHRGILAKLSRTKLEAIALSIGRCIIRTVRSGRPPVEHPSMVDTGASRARDIVALLRVPTDEEFEAAMDEFRKGRLMRRPRPFVPLAGDQPVADLIFLKYIGGATLTPFPIDAKIPGPVSKTGIRFPPKNAIPARG